MTDNEIIKALECCGNQMYLCNDKQCKSKTLGDAIDLINSQKAEIKQWKEEANRWQNAFCKANEDIATAKIESIKEFVEKVKDIAYPLLPHDTARDGFDLHLTNLLKEMFGEELEGLS